MTVLSAAAWVLSLLLVAAGTPKITRPAAAGAALQIAHLPSDARLMRLLGAGEVGLGLLVVGLGGVVPIALLAAAYAGFAVFAERQRRQGAGCGCFGEAMTPATLLHVWFNAIAAAIAGGAAVGPAPSLLSAIADSPPVGLLAALLLVVAAGLLRLLLTAAPELSAAIALVEPHSDA